MGGCGRWGVVAMGLAAGLCWHRVASGAIGDPDLSFGSGGSVVTQLGQGATPNSLALDVKQQADGKIVAAGAVTDAAGALALTLVRYLPSGAFDPSFGAAGSGVVTQQFGGGAMPTSAVFYSGLVIQPDGAIVGCGIATDTNGDSAVLVTRYTPAGVLDGSFASGGKFLTQFGLGTPPNSNLFACKLQPDGKIVGVGGRNDAAGNTEVIAIRLTTGGTPDPGFGSGGVFTQQLGGGATPTSVGADLVVLASGQIVVSIAVDDATDQTAMGIARLSAGGTLDPGFGSGGFTRTAFGGPTPFSEGVQISLQSSGKFVVSGDGDDTLGNPAFLMARYTAAGALDPSFGDSGRVITQPSAALTPAAVATGQVLQPNGKVILLGRATDVGGMTASMTLARYTSEGPLDGTFGSTSIVQKQLATGPTATTNATGGHFTTDGKLIAVGSAGATPTSGSWFVASFIADEAPNAAFTFAPASPAVGDAVSLDASASNDPGGSVSEIAWDLDNDGAFDDATGVTAATSFTTGGPHPVNVRVTDDNGLQRTATTAIPVVCGVAQSFLSLDCRLAELLATVDAQVPAGTVHDKLAGSLTTARTLAQAAAGAGPGKAAKRSLSKANKAVGKFMAGVRKGKKSIDKSVRDALLAAAKGIRSVVKQLRKA